ncbi:MAG: PAS domain S-box protein [Leptospira sp.]|nr:PAS domain S-box protein [Leptospira sp.]
MNEEEKQSTGRIPQTFEFFRSSVLELIVSNSNLSDLLDYLVLGIEAFSPENICSILLIENQKLAQGSAPNLPNSYNEKIYGVQIGEGQGSCGTAAAIGKRVIVEDIQTHPYWQKYKEIAKEAGLAACWSEPIFSSEKKVIGTFAIYRREITSPTKRDIEIIESAANLASIAIERTISRRRLEESELRFRNFFEKNSSVMLLIEPTTGQIIDANMTACKYYEYTREEILQLKIQNINILPEEKITEERKLASEEKRNYFQFPHKLASGEIRQVEVHTTPIETNGQKVLFSIIHDITERKIAEEKVATLLSEKELILREVHHRIKNNMSVMYNLLELQTDAILDENAIRILKDAASRIKSMALLYDKLYLGRDFHVLSLDKYLPTLAEEILSHFPGSEKIELVCKVEPISLRQERLQPLGIITNEILTNTMKYAFSKGTNGKIQIQAFSDDKIFTLIIEDNGRGIPKKENGFENEGFGLTLVRMLTKQLKGKLNIETGTDKGTKFHIQFFL